MGWAELVYKFKTNVWVVVSAADDPSVFTSQSQRRPLLGPSPGWRHLVALSHLRHYKDTMLNGRWPHGN